MATTIYQDADCSIRDYVSILGLRGLLAVIKAKVSGRPTTFCVDRLDSRYPFTLRIPSSDVRTYEQIFIRQDYYFEVRRDPQVIIDAGANIGLASIYFANRFPGAKIIAIEPEKGNFDLLKKNSAPYSNIIPIWGALWDKNRNIDLIDPGLGQWGYRTQQGNPAGRNSNKPLYTVRGMTVDSLMQEYGIDRVDIFKIDIEGAEREVFNNAGSWINNVDSVIIELHERIKKGCNRSFYCATNGFDDEWLQGENVYLARNEGCLVRKSF
jgi:FkbM family methyltransferase